MCAAGQLEARERLLGEMEQKARERVEAAEVESYRLKGKVVELLRRNVITITTAICVRDFHVTFSGCFSV